MGRRFAARESLRNAAIWVGIFAVCIVGYALRNDFETLGTKIRAELIPSYPIASAHSMTLTASEGGSFYTMGTIDGANAMFLIDTGASDIVLSPADAQRAGIDISQLDYSRPFESAHGAGRGASIVIDQLSIGPITLRNVRATVNESPMRTSLLGITFLQSLESFEIRGNKLTLRWRQ
jgi:aspartyl protease family protein